jgi:hypothetical protein
VQRALRRGREFVFLPNFSDYAASHGDVGFLATIVDHRPVPSANPAELPRADVHLRFDGRCIVLFHWVRLCPLILRPLGGSLAACRWLAAPPLTQRPTDRDSPLQIESNTGGLAECLCTPIDPALPAWPLVDAEALAAAVSVSRTTEIDRALVGTSLMPSAPHQHPDAAHFVLHASSAARAEAALAAIDAELPGVRASLFPVVAPHASATAPLTTLNRQLCALWLRHAPNAARAHDAPLPAALAAPTDADDDAAGGAAPRTDGSADVSVGTGSATTTTSSSSSTNSTSSSTTSGSSGTADEAAARAFRAMPLRELRSRLASLRISPSAACLEKDDLVALLTTAARRQRLAAAAASAAAVVAHALVGLAVPLACGCPTDGMRIRECHVARAADGFSVAFPRADALWGAGHDFVLDEHRGAHAGHPSVGQVRSGGGGARRRA